MATNTSRKIFDENIDNSLNEVLHFIKEAYIEYFGEKYRGKIENVFNKLKIVIIADNYSKVDLYKEIYSIKQKMAKDIKTIQKQKGISEEEVLSIVKDAKRKTKDPKIISLRKDFLRLGFCNRMLDKRINDNNKKVILHYFNCPSYYTPYDDLIVNHDANAASVNQDNESIIYIPVDRGGLLNLSTIVHEIGHCVCSESLYEENGNIHTISGIYENELLTMNKEDNDHKFINEVINECITYEIMDIIKTKHDFRDIMSYDFRSIYLIVDSLYGDLIRRTYELLKKEIKENLITSNALVIKRIINAYNSDVFEVVNNRYNRTSDRIIAISDSTGKKLTEAAESIREEEQKENKSVVEKAFEFIKLGYKKFLEDRANQEKLIDQLVKEGKARRVK